MYDMIKNDLINYFKLTQPYRFLGKSIRNLLFPSKDENYLRKLINIEVSNICNVKCIFCIYRFDYREKRVMSVEDFRKLSKVAIDLGYENLGLTPLSGELFTNRNAIEMIKIAQNVGFRNIGTYTNGILLHHHNVEELLTSGINVIVISFPGFCREIYREIFQADKFEEFKESVTLLLETHKRNRSEVTIIFEAKSYLTLNQIKEQDFYKEFISKFINDTVSICEPKRIFDSWCGEIKQKYLFKGMKVEINPIKSIYPLKKPYPCMGMFTFGVLVNGNVRLCNCRGDMKMGTEKDSLFIGNVYNYRDLKELLHENKGKIEKIRFEFCNGKMPVECKLCSFYLPVKFS